MWTIGTDVGGTFTDLVAISEDGEVKVAKVPSTPPAFEHGVVDALREAGLQAGDARTLCHATTVSTNALLTRIGANTAIIATAGFRDVIEIRDGSREEYYDILWDPPAPLVARHNRLEVRERVDYAGNVIEPLVAEDVREIARVLRAREIEAVAVALLHSYANPAHERLVRDLLLEALPDLYVTISSDVLPHPPELVRTSTTVANAYVGPVLRRYVDRLQTAVSTGRFAEDLVIMHSGGGTMTPENTLSTPIRTASSGPAAGVLAAAAISAAIGRSNVVSLDMGGTSADIGTIKDGKPSTTVESAPEWGMPLGFPSIEVVVVGAGGGSIAWIDRAGVPHSGPSSAGALPGPACYMRGGEEPTTTDANLVLQRMRPESLLDGQMTLDPALAREAIESRFSGPLNMDLFEAAEGIVRIANEHMINGIRRVTIQRGLDPRDFSLMAFGGAGGMHAAEIAKEMKMAEVIIPLNPGATSALGSLFADARHDMVESLIAATEDLDAADLERRFSELERRGGALLDAEGFPTDRIRFERIIEIRYAGQLRALEIPLVARPVTQEAIDAAVEAFGVAYEREFKYAVPGLPLESKAIRVIATGVTMKPPFVAADGEGKADEALIGESETYFREAGGLVATKFYARNRLHPGARFDGPAVVEQYDSTTLIPPGASVEVDEYRNMIVRL